MKRRILSFFLMTVIFITNSVSFGTVHAFEEKHVYEYGYEYNRLLGLGIINSDEEQDFNPEKEITRAELACSVVGFLNMEDTASVMKETNLYPDVKADMFASGHIALLTKLGAYGDDVNGAFVPDKIVTVGDALNLIVYVTGYNNITRGIYYSHPVYAKLLKGIKAGTNQVLTQGILLMLIDNALDIELLSAVYSTKGSINWKVSSNTAFEVYFPEYFEVEGVVQAIGGSALFDDGVENGDIMIDGRTYRVGDADVDNMLGKSVVAFGKETDVDFVLTAMVEDYSKNTTLYIDGADILSVAGRTISCYVDGRNKALRLANNVTVVYNGRPASERELSRVAGGSASVFLVDNNSDKKYDVVKIDFYEYTPVKSINTDLNIIYFENIILGGLNYIKTESDEPNYVWMYDESGELCSVDDIKSGDILSVSRSIDGRFTKIYALDMVVITPRELSDEAVLTDNGEYVIKPGIYNYDSIMDAFQLGKECDVFVDGDGYIVYVADDASVTPFVYGYIYDMAEPVGLDSLYQLRILTGTYASVKKIGDETPAYKLEGTSEQELVIYRLKSKVRLNNLSQNADKAFEQLKIGDVIRYKASSDGTISAVIQASPSGVSGDRNLNCKEQVFGGITEGAFGFDESTVMFFVPLSGNPDDVSVKVSLDSGTSYSVRGYDMRNKGYEVNAAVVSADMQLYDTIEFGKNAPLSIIYKKSYIMDENGLNAYKLTGYTNGVEFEYITNGERSEVNDVARGIKPGDVVYLSLDFNGKIGQLLKIASVSPDGDYYHTGKNSSSEKIFASIAQAEEKVLGAYDSEYKNRMQLSLGNGKETTVSIRYNDGPQMYIYDTVEKLMLPCSFNDIASMYYEDVFVFLQSTDAKIVVAVR